MKLILTPQEVAEIAVLYHKLLRHEEELAFLVKKYGVRSKQVKGEAQKIIYNFLPRYRAKVPEKVQKIFGDQFSQNKLERLVD